MKNTTISNETIEQNGKQKAIPFVEEANLRDYFAAKALQGWLASYPDDNKHPVIVGNADKVAKNAYQMADAMLRAREAS